jgi:LemA protein
MQLIIGISIAILILYIVLTYNKFVTYINSIKQSLSGIDIQLKRRTDIIPNLVAVVKGYATHERQLLVTITQLRSQLITAQTNAQKNQVNTELSSTLKTLFATAEQYPQLKANEQFVQLQKELVATENELAASRRIYAENVALYNTLIESIPSSLIAKMAGFKKTIYEKL